LPAWTKAANRLPVQGAFEFKLVVTAYIHPGLSYDKLGALRQNSITALKRLLWPISSGSDLGDDFGLSKLFIED
jgi:hypothetical protein